MNTEVQKQTELKPNERRNRIIVSCQEEGLPTITTIEFSLAPFQTGFSCWQIGPSALSSKVIDEAARLAKRMVENPRSHLKADCVTIDEVEWTLIGKWA